MFSFVRNRSEPQQVSAVHNEQTWEEDDLQFMRLLSVLRKRLTDKQLKAVACDMHIGRDDLTGLLDRAEAAWGGVLEQTYPEGYFPALFEKELLLNEFASYKHDAPPVVLRALATHLVQFEFNHEVGGAAIRVEPELIDPSNPAGLTVGLTIQQGRPQLFITSAAGDEICIGTNEAGELYQIEMDAEQHESVE